MLDVINFQLRRVVQYVYMYYLIWGYSAVWGLAVDRNKQHMQNFSKILVDVSYSELVDIILVGFDFLELLLCLHDID